MTDSAVAEKLREGRLRAAERQTVRDALRKIMVDAEDNGELDGFERGGRMGVGNLSVFGKSRVAIRVCPKGKELPRRVDHFLT